MAELALGPIGVVVGRPGDDDGFLDAAPVLEALGYATIWLAGPSIKGLAQVRSVVARAGADQVALSVLSADPPGSLPVGQWRQLAKALIS